MKNSGVGAPAAGESVDTRVPAVLPILPISEAVIFPYMMVPLVLTDQKLIQLADDCLAGDKMLGAFAQRGGDEEEEPGEEESALYRVGTAVKIQKMLRFPDGSMRLLGQGVAAVGLLLQALGDPRLLPLDRVGPLRRAVMREGIQPAAGQPRLMRGGAL